MTHSSETEPVCDREIYDYDLVRAEAMIYAIDYANAHLLSDINITLAWHAFNYCKNSQIAFEIANTLRATKKATTRYYAVIGSMISEVLMEMSLGLNCIPVISNIASGDFLLQRKKYPLTLGTTPVNRQQAEAMLQTLLALNMTNVVVFSQGMSSFAQSLADDFQRAVRRIYETLWADFTHDPPGGSGGAEFYYTRHRRAFEFREFGRIRP